MTVITLLHYLPVTFIVIKVVSTPMQGDTTPLAQLEFYTKRQGEEATLHWTRNNYFLVGISFLVVAYGLSVQSTSGAVEAFRALLIVLGMAMSAVWLLIQYRSSQYILHYKNVAHKISKDHGLEDPYPQTLGGYEMRKLAYALPVIFIVFWVGLASVLAISH